MRIDAAEGPTAAGGAGGQRRSARAGDVGADGSRGSDLRGRAVVLQRQNVDLIEKSLELVRSVTRWGRARSLISTASKWSCSRPRSSSFSGRSMPSGPGPCSRSWAGPMTALTLAIDDWVPSAVDRLRPERCTAPGHGRHTAGRGGGALGRKAAAARLELARLGRRAGCLRRSEPPARTQRPGGDLPDYRRQPPLSMTTVRRSRAVHQSCRPARIRTITCSSNRRGGRTASIDVQGSLRLVG